MIQPAWPIMARIDTLGRGVVSLQIVAIVVFSFLITIALQNDSQYFRHSMFVVFAVSVVFAILVLVAVGSRPKELL